MPHFPHRLAPGPNAGMADSPSPPRSAHTCPGQQCSLKLQKHLPQAREADFWGEEMQHQCPREVCSLGREPCETPPWKPTVGRQAPRTSHRGLWTRTTPPVPRTDLAAPRASAWRGCGVKGTAVCVMFQVSGEGRAGPGRGCRPASERPCGHVSLLCLTPGLLSRHRGCTPLKALRSPVLKEMVKSGRVAGKPWRRTEAQRLANWRAGPAWGEGRAPGQCPPEPGLGRAGGIVIELAEVRAPLNEAEQERGSEGPGIMRPK